MPLDLSHELRVSRALALRAGAAILDHYRADFAVEYKSEGDPVTQADKDANEIIVQGLQAEFPSDGILAEESPDAQERLQRSRLWCVDPLDGTREFVARNGQFVVMIGLAIDGEARLGVVFQPTEGRLWSGVVGQGAHAEDVDGNATPIAVSACDKPQEATLMMSRSHRSKTVDAVSAGLGIVRSERMGSVGLKACRVAAGDAHLYVSVSNSTHEWDACGPEAILRAAGGKVTDICGRPLVYNKTDSRTPYGILASNGDLHAQVAAALEPVAEKKGWR